MTTLFERVYTRDEFGPIFVSEKVTKDEAGRRRFKGISSQRLSNIVRLSYIGAQIKSLLPKHIRSMASSKVDIVGIPEKVFLSHCQWTSMQTFKKYYKKKFSSDPPEVSGASFNDALNAGLKFPGPEVQCIAMRANVARVLAATAANISFSTVASNRSLQMIFKISDRQIDEAIRFDAGLSYPPRTSERLRKKKELHDPGSKETLWREAQHREVLVTFSVLKVTRFS